MLIGRDNCYMHETVTAKSLMRQHVEWYSVSWGEGFMLTRNNCHTEGRNSSQ